MSNIQLLRVLVNERLSTAAEEIFEAVRKTVASYEEELLLSKREIRRQRRMLQTVSDMKFNKNSEQPELALSVWDEELTTDQQDHCDQEWIPSLDPDDDHPTHGEKSVNDATSSQEGELTENATIRFIFTPSYVKNEPEMLPVSKGEGDPLPGTSAKQDQLKEEEVDAASSSSHATEDSADEWRGSAISQSDESANERRSKRKKSRPPTIPQLDSVKRLKSPICCRVCGKAFHATVSLINHMEVHPKDICGVCGECFGTEEDFRAHLRTHMNAEVCSVCGKCFGAASSLETHMRIHTGEKPFNCSECGKSFNCRHNMMRHIRIHTGEKPYPCTVCRKSFSDYSTLKRHLMVHVHKKNSNPTSASINEISEDGETKRKASPQKKHSNRPICQVCGKMFHSIVSLVNHAKSHTTDICGVCGTQFDSEESLRDHLKSHKNGKVCEVCGKCFDSQGNLEMHMRIHTGEKPFLCSECGKSFNCRHNMMRHMRTHTGEKPYLCNICGRCFSDHSTLKQHSSTHSGEKPHRCEICGKGFLRKTYVKLHMRCHSSEK